MSDGLECYTSLEHELRVRARNARAIGPSGASTTAPWALPMLPCPL